MYEQISAFFYSRLLSHAMVMKEKVTVFYQGHWDDMYYNFIPVWSLVPICMGCIKWIMNVNGSSYLCHSCVWTGHHYYHVISLKLIWIQMYWFVSIVNHNHTMNIWLGPTYCMKNDRIYFLYIFIYWIIHSTGCFINYYWLFHYYW